MPMDLYVLDGRIVPVEGPRPAGEGVTSTVMSKKLIAGMSGSALISSIGEPDPTDTGQLELDLGITIDERQRRQLSSENPMVRSYGFGPDGERCKNCKFVYKKVSNKSGNGWYKCKKRVDKNSRDTDHRLKWPACWHFAEK